MESALEFLGFTTPQDMLWNGAAYASIIVISLVVLFWERYINQVFAIGGLVLGVYAFAFLHDQLFGVLQGIVVISAMLGWMNINRPPLCMIMAVCTLAALVWLSQHSIIMLEQPITIVGAAGLVSLALGVTILPSSRHGLLVFAFGGGLLMWYSWVVGAQVFFFLNIIFTTVNFLKWDRHPLHRKKT